MFATLTADLPHVLLPPSMYSFSPRLPMDQQGGTMYVPFTTTDNQTPQPALTYNIMIGTSSNSFDIVSPLSNKYNGKRWIPALGNAGTRDSYIFSATGLANGTYYWKVQAIDNVFGASAFSTEATFTVPYTSAKAAGTDSLANRDSTAIAQTIPETFALSQNYPNPFNPTTRLNLNLSENGRVKAIVYDLTGQEVARLQDAEMTAGYRYLDWDGKNTAGATVSSGIYLVKVVFEGISGLRQEATSRVALLK
ncbi:MAG: T9SS type A sorting domain-containing protein [candidate division KSB1 bacterium]|nr:T9SS type A sorting domain-containing protein [candidate division KSB1 bacterium]MDZ7368446.1 T9SS type A sorting domain-containing protein [candidate division KSB1 bacterium]MDZ7406172.1 T9SS type A sorting domain-containing protein [candidate division KSB1 bacterium]